MSIVTIDTEHLTQEQVATLLGVSIKSIDNYTKYATDPMPFGKIPNKKTGKSYNWTEVFKWWTERENKKAEKYLKFTPKDAIEAAKLEGQNLKNELDQIEIERKKGILVEAEDVARVWSNALVDIKQSLRNVGHIAATDIIDGMTYNKKKKVIDTLIFQNLKTVIEKVEDDSIEVPANETS
jgi:phage terminase Nu1 subunit (DNA packaging protein)